MKSCGQCGGVCDWCQKAQKPKPCRRYGRCIGNCGWCKIWDAWDYERAIHERATLLGTILIIYAMAIAYTLVFYLTAQ
jgi:hypothetical protein